MKVTESSESVLAGTKRPPFRLVVRAVSASGQRLPVRPAVSEEFVVRARGPRFSVCRMPFWTRAQRRGRILGQGRSAAAAVLGPACPRLVGPAAPVDFVHGHLRTPEGVACRPRRLRVWQGARRAPGRPAVPARAMMSALRPGACALLHRARTPVRAPWSRTGYVESNLTLNLP